MRSLFLILAVLLAAGLVLQSGCGSSSSPTGTDPEPELVDLSGAVTGYSAAGLTIHNAHGDWSVGADGSFTLSVPASGGCQLGIVQTSDETPVLLGWLGESRQEVGYRSTAEVLAYFALGGYLLPLDLQSMLIEALEADLAVDDLADAVEAALAENASSLIDPDSAGAQAVRTALIALSDHLRELYGPATEGDKALLISPSDARSGTHVLADGSRVNTVQVVNDYRRRSYAEIGQESWVREADGVTVTTGTPLEDSPRWIDPTNGVGSGTLSVTEDIFNGIYDVGTFAYQPVLAGTFTLPVPDGAASATYSITTVGPGVGLGDLTSLTAAQQQQALFVGAYSLVTDMIIPAMMSVIVPVSTAGGTGDAFDRLLKTPGAIEILEDITNLLLAEPDVVSDLSSGEYVQALRRSWETVVQGGAFQTLSMNFFSYSVLALENAGVLSTAQVNSALATTSRMASVFRGLEIADLILAAGDLGVVVAHIGLSNMADVWTITVFPPEVVLSPQVSRIDPFGTAALTAAVPELTGSTSDVSFKYLWSCTGNNGVIADAAGHSGTGFESSYEFVDYIAESGTTGGDRVSVQVTQVITDGTGTHETEIGSDSAIVLVGGDGTWMDPPEAELQPNETITLTLAVLVDEETDDPADLTYQWTCDEQYGTIIAGGTASDSTLTYQAGFNAAEAEEIITAEAFLPGDGGLESQGESSATVTVAPPDLRIVPVAPVVLPEESITLTAEVDPAPDGTLGYAWTCTDDYGVLSGSGVSVDYLAGTEEGHDVVEVEITLTPPGGAATVLGTAGVAVEVDAPASGEACELILDSLPYAMYLDSTPYRYYNIEVLDCYGDPVEGETVTLSIDGPGHFDDTVLTTNANGRGQTRINADAMGAALVTGETSNGVVASVYWIFGGDVELSQSEGVLVTDNDMVELYIIVTSGDLMGATMDYGWTISQTSVDNWWDYAADLVEDEADPMHATLYAGWAPNPPDSIRVVAGAYANWGDQEVRVGLGHYLFTTTYAPMTIAPTVVVETCEVPENDWYRATVRGGFEWSAAEGDQFRYFLYHEDCPAGSDGMEWVKAGLLCGQLYDSGYEEDHPCWEPDEEKVRYPMFTATESFDNAADREDWISEMRLLAQQDVALYSMEYQAIRADWPPTEGSCYGYSPPVYNRHCPE